MKQNSFHKNSLTIVKNPYCLIFKFWSLPSHQQNHSSLKQIKVTFVLITIYGAKKYKLFVHANWRRHFKSRYGSWSIKRFEIENSAICGIKHSFQKKVKKSFPFCLPSVESAFKLISLQSLFLNLLFQLHKCIYMHYNHTCSLLSLSFPLPL